MTRIAYVLGRAIHEKTRAPVGTITVGEDSPLISWISYAGLAATPELEEALRMVQINSPGTEVYGEAYRKYVADVKKFLADTPRLLRKGKAIPGMPGFPGMRQMSKPTTTYNRIISPLRPLALRGIVFVPDRSHVEGDGERAAIEPETMVKDWRRAYEDKTLPFVYAQPSAKLTPAVTTPKISGSAGVPMDTWISGEQHELIEEVVRRAVEAGY